MLNFSVELTDFIHLGSVIQPAVAHGEHHDYGFIFFDVKKAFDTKLKFGILKDLNNKGTCSVLSYIVAFVEIVILHPEIKKLVYF